tara:strand:- start:1379 stop:1573 length:195 start_codon:yes stop_codon:yes gene_type:complete
MEDTYTITHAYHTEWVGNIHTGMAQYTRSFKTINLAEIWFENYGKKIEQMFDRKLILIKRKVLN